MSYQCFVEGCQGGHVSKHEICTASSNEQLMHKALADLGQSVLGSWEKKDHEIARLRETLTKIKVPDHCSLAGLSDAHTLGYWMGVAKGFAAIAAQALTGSAVETKPPLGQEPWRLSLPVITVQMLADYGQEGFFEKTDQPVQGIPGVSWSSAAVDFACMLQGRLQERLAVEPTTDGYGCTGCRSTPCICDQLAVKAMAPHAPIGSGQTGVCPHGVWLERKCDQCSPLNGSETTKVTR